MDAVTVTGGDTGYIATCADKPMIGTGYQHTILLISHERMAKDCMKNSYGKCLHFTVH